jgi:hypothetical protein
VSGISRLRAAHKGGGSLSIDHVSQKEGRNGSARDCAESLTVSKKKGAWETFPNTGVPSGNESPHRGEATNPGNRSQGMK